MAKKIAVIGAGVSGISASETLLKAGKVKLIIGKHSNRIPSIKTHSYKSLVQKKLFTYTINRS